ncbi:MAG: hypothetical protein DRJ42_11625 [Deltaproteobacteria bacterium]|nr:MAG: hypothetical protein DRJ42_11625 [Deltaproteobacteria bacterium]
MDDVTWDEGRSCESTPTPACCETDFGGCINETIGVAMLTEERDLVPAGCARALLRRDRIRRVAASRLAGPSRTRYRLHVYYPLQYDRPMFRLRFVLLLVLLGCGGATNGQAPLLTSDPSFEEERPAGASSEGPSLQSRLLEGRTEPSRLARLIDFDRGVWVQIMDQHGGELFCSEAAMRSSLSESELDSLFPMGDGDFFECADDLSYCINRPGADGSPYPWADMAVRFAFHEVASEPRLHAIDMQRAYDDEDVSDDWDPWEYAGASPADGCRLSRAAQAGFETDGLVEIRPTADDSSLEVISHCGSDATARLGALLSEQEGGADCGNGICRYFGAGDVVDFYLRGDPLRVWMVAAITTSDGYSLDHGTQYEALIDNPPPLDCPP